jgi:membrane protein implicated in regulation of membrane protease activity
MTATDSAASTPKRGSPEREITRRLKFLEALLDALLPVSAAVAAYGLSVMSDATSWKWTLAITVSAATAMVVTKLVLRSVKSQIQRRLESVPDASKLQSTINRVTRTGPSSFP